MPNKNDKNDKREVFVKVKRQPSPKATPHWEEFRLQWRPYMNVIICLRDISENPSPAMAAQPLQSPTIRIASKKSAAPAPCSLTAKREWPVPR